MGKNKLVKWAELETFSNVIQPQPEDMSGEEHPLRGNWRRDIFRNSNPIVLELACGKGEYSIALSEIFTDKNFIGIDIKGARMWRGAKTASEAGSANVGFLRTRIEFISSFFADNEADEIWLPFPDPHLGKKNSNKRLTCPWFLNKYRILLKDKGLVHLKTDNKELFNYTRRLVKASSIEILFESDNIYSLNSSQKSDFGMIFTGQTCNAGSDIIADQILGIKTHYERMFLKEGVKINHLTFRLEKNKIIADEKN